MRLRLAWLAWLVVPVLAACAPGDAAPPARDAARDALTFATGPLRRSAANPRYFSDGSGKIIYLTGSHTWQTLKDRGLVDPPAAFDYTAYLDFMVAHGHNFFRLWTWEQPHSWNNNPDNLKRTFTPFAWQRTGPGMANDGKPRFDLTKFDQAYFDRMRARTIAAGTHGIYVAITLFDGWDVRNAYNPTDGGYPYGAGNNVNGLAAGGPESHTLGSAAVTAAQEAYVAKVVDTVNDLNNVLYEISNESPTSSVAWQYHFIDFVKQLEAAKPRRHPVGMTSVLGSDADLVASNADWIAPGDPYYAGTGAKVVINDSDHSFYWPMLKAAGVDGQRVWAWKNFMLGSGVLFMDPYLEPWAGRNTPSGTTLDPFWDPLRAVLGHIRAYADRLDLAHAVPSPALSSTGSCLAARGAQYLVYQPSSGAFSVTLEAGTYAVEWFNPRTAAVTKPGSATAAAGAQSFTPPFSGDAVLLLSSPTSATVPASRPFTLATLAGALLALGLLRASANRQGRHQASGPVETGPVDAG